MKKLILLSILLIVGSLFGQKEPKGLIKHSILKDDLYDAPVKTQVQLDVLIEETEISEMQVRELLNHLYFMVSNRVGFKYHKNPTNIYIYTYSSKDKLTSGTGQWVGMISKGYGDTQPNLKISKKQLESLLLVPEKKFGLSETIRIEIWNEIFFVEDRAQIEADKKYSLDKAGISIDDIQSNVELARKLKKKYTKNMVLKLQ